VALNWEVVWEYRAALADGLKLTLDLSAWSLVGSLALGTLVGCLGALPGYFTRRLVAAYVELLRNLPVVVKLFFLYFAVGLDAMAAGYLALITHQSAYVADVIASGFRSVPREQSEAALVLGHSRFQVFRHVLLPQVFRLVLPPLTNQFIEVVKNSAIVMLVGVQELTFQAQNIESETFRGFEAASVATACYVLIALAIAGGMALLQRRLRLA